MGQQNASVPREIVFNTNRQIGIALFIISGVINLLTLTGALYMLQIYDRVLSSHSVPTLVALSILVIGLYLFQGLLDIIRGQILVRLGAKVDLGLMTLAHECLLRLPLRGASTSQAVQPIRDVESVRGFLASPALTAFLDLPWMPLYIAFVFFLHPLLGFLAIIGLLLLCVLTLSTESLTRKTGVLTQTVGAQRAAMAESHARNCEVIAAMGLAENASHRFSILNLKFLDHNSKTSDIGSTLGGISKVIRMILQSAILGVGAYLTLQGQLSAGAIIAASIGTSRAFAPVELAIANWSNFINARHSYHRLSELFSHFPPETKAIHLQPPVNTLSVEDVSVSAPGSEDAILSNISFTLEAGDALGLIGPSASGKSTLARALTGIWPCVRGHIRLDGAALEQWSALARGRHIGYLPQDVELFPGTIADNISRMDREPDSIKIIDAAKAAGVHDMILKLPQGYETELGNTGRALSAGQRQRIALARALYGDPFLIVLDEPNSNLDAQGEEALTLAIKKVRDRDGIVIVIAHRPSALAAVNKVGVLAAGRLASIGPRDEVLKEVLKKSPARSGLAVVPSEGA